MEKARQLLEELKKDLNNEELADELQTYLNSKEREVFNHPNRIRSRFIISCEGKFTSDDAFLYEDLRYKEIFLEDVIDTLFLYLFDEQEEEKVEKTFNIFEYMYENKITSYAQDW